MESLLSVFFTFFAGPNQNLFQYITDAFSQHPSLPQRRPFGPVVFNLQVELSESRLLDANTC